MVMWDTGYHEVGTQQLFDKEQSPGDWINHFQVKYYSWMRVWTSGDNLYYQVWWGARPYNPKSYTNSFDTVASAWGVYPDCSSYASRWAAEVSPYSVGPMIFNDSTSGAHLVSSRKIQVSGYASISGDNYDNRYADPIWISSPEFNIANPTYTANVVSRTPTSITINVNKTSDYLGLWRFIVYSITDNKYVTDRFDGGSITINNLTPNKNYTLRVDAVWVNRNDWTGGSTTLSNISTLHDYPTVNISSTPNITHESFKVVLDTNLHGSSVKKVDWSIRGVFKDFSGELTFSNTNTTQVFQNINGHLLVPNTEYIIKARVTNSEDSTSDWTTPKVVKTIVQLPSISSIVLSNTKFDRTHCTVNYVTYAGVKSIEISVTPKLSTSWRVVSNNTTSSLWITGLRPNTEYIVKAVFTDTLGRSVSSLVECKTANDPPKINSVTISSQTYHGCTVDIDYRIVTEQESFMYQVTRTNGSVVFTGQASSHFVIDNPLLVATTRYFLKVVLKDVYGDSAVVDTEFTTKDDRVVSLVRSGGITKHRVYLIKPNGNRIQVLPEQLHLKR